MNDAVMLENGNLNASGKIKIEIFDDLTGKKVQEVNGENYINPLLLPQYSKNNQLSPFLYVHPNADTGNYRLGSGTEYMLKYAVLTNSNKPKDEVNDRHVWGDLVGYVDNQSTYNVNTAGNTLRGSYNASETYHTKWDKFFWSYDFPAHVSNGTFNNIYMTNGTTHTWGTRRLWANTNEYGSLRPEKRLTTSGAGNPYASYGISSGSYGGTLRFNVAQNRHEIWTIESDRSATTRNLVRLNESWNVLETITLTGWSTATLGSSTYDVTFDNEFIYVSCQTKGIAKFNLDGTFNSLVYSITDAAVKTAWGAITGSPQGTTLYCYGFEYSRTEDCFYMATSHGLKKIDKQFAFIEDVAGTTGSYITNNGAITTSKDGTKLYFMQAASSSDVIYIKHIPSNSYSYSKLATSSVSPTWTANWVVELPNTPKYIVGVQGAYVYYAPFDGNIIRFGSRYVLDAPITKTSANTMKITYEFSIPEMAMKNPLPNITNTNTGVTTTDYFNTPSSLNMGYID
jgi:hypothetical protein